MELAIFEISNIQFYSEEVRTKTIETRWNECEKGKEMKGTLFKCRVVPALKH